MKCRRFIALLLLVSMTMAVAGCGGAKEAPETIQETESAVPATEEVTVPETLPATEETTVPETVETEPVSDGFVLSATLDPQGKPVIHWPEVDGAAAYEFRRGLDRVMDGDPLATTGETSYTHTAAAEGRSYFYQVRAVDAEGNVLQTTPVARFSAGMTQPETPVTRYVNIPKIKLHHVAQAGEDPIELPYMAEVQVGSIVQNKKTGNWCRIFYEGELYYLFDKFSEDTFTTEKSTFTYVGNTQYQQQVLDLAVDICFNWKTIYRDASKGEIVDDEGTRAFHCSGMISFILNGVMEPIVPVYWVSTNLLKTYETGLIYNGGLPGELVAQDVPLSDLQPGDVLFFRSQLDTTGSMEIGHCGLYLGNNEFLHCTSVWEKGVCIMPLTNDFEVNLLKIRRFLPESVAAAEMPCVVSGPYEEYDLYEMRSVESEVILHPRRGDRLTLLYDGSGNWAYVRTEDGTEGFFERKYLVHMPGEQ